MKPVEQLVGAHVGMIPDQQNDQEAAVGAQDVVIETIQSPAGSEHNGQLSVEEPAEPSGNGNETNGGTRVAGPRRILNMDL